MSKRVVILTDEEIDRLLDCVLDRLLDWGHDDLDGELYEKLCSLRLKGGEPAQSIAAEARCVAPSRGVTLTEEQADRLAAIEQMLDLLALLRGEEPQ